MTDASEAYTGGTTLNSGVLIVASGALGTGALKLVGGNLQANTDFTLANALTLTNTFTTISGTGELTFSGTATLTGVNALTITNTSNSTTFSGQLTGSGSLEKLGANFLILTPATASNYTGGTVLEAGTLQIGSASSALGTGSLTLGGGNLQTTVVGGVTLANPVILDGATVTLNGTQNLTFGSASLTGISTVNTSSAPTTTFQGALSGSGALTKTGGETLVLAGSDSQTGAITSDGSGGTLVINTTNTTGPVGAILGTVSGTGTLGPISAGANVGAASGTFNPGTTADIEQVASANFSNGGDLTIQITGYGTAGVNYDQLNVTGALTLGGTSTLTVNLANLTVPGTATGVVLFGSRTGYMPVFDQVAVINNPNNFSVQVIYNANSIDIVVVPGGSVAPSTPTLLALGTVVSTNVSEVISDFKATTAGTYTIAVSGTPGTSYSLVITSNADFDTEPNNSFATAQNLDGAAGVLGFVSGSAADWYSFSVSAGDPLVLQTSIPAEGPGAFVNTLNPNIQLFNPAGSPVASGGVQADGRNQQIVYTALATGLYEVEVSSQGSTSGEYFVSVGGNTGTAGPFQVVSTNIANGTVLEAAPTTYTVSFNENYLVTSVNASDLVVDGTMSPTGVTLVDGNTLSFTMFPSLGAGVHTLTIAAGAIEDVQGTPITAFTGNFTINTAPPTVVATSIPPGGDIAPGSLTYVVTFSEAMLVSNLAAADFTLHGNFTEAAGVNYTPSGFSFDPTGTILTLNYTGLPVDDYTLTLISGITEFANQIGEALDGEFSGTFPSGNGVAGGNFVIGFNMVQGTVAYPTPLVGVLPQGSLIYTGSSTGLITSAGDTDSFTLVVDPNETIAVVVTPTSGATLQPTVSLFSPTSVQLGSTAVASAAGQNALLQAITAATGGTYTITVSDVGGTTGFYSVAVTLNAALDPATYLSGVSNSTLAMAQALDGSFITLAPSSATRGAVLGSNAAVTAPATWQNYYSVNLNAGDTITLGMKDLSGTGVTFSLLSPTGLALAASVAGPTNLDEVITDFPAIINPGEYYILVTGQAAASYALVITRNAVFDTGPNDTLATAQSLDGTEGALGAIAMQGVNTVVPNADTNTAGGGNNEFPFDIAAASETSMRYQQIYSHTQFATGGVISAISFRRGAGEPTFSTAGINVRIDIGYAATTVASISSTFATNRSSSMVTVFSGLLSLSSSGSGTPNPFDIVINVSPLFNYNPSQGDLLVDIFMMNEPSTTGFDFASTPLGATARVFSASSVNNTTGTIGQNGLVTSFGFVPTPVDNWYTVNLTSTSNALTLETSIPAGGPGQFADNLIPEFALYGPSGNLVATSTLGLDGNQHLQYVASVPGTYSIDVFDQGNTSGEYFLSRDRQWASRPLRLFPRWRTRSSTTAPLSARGCGRSPSTSTEISRPPRRRPSR